MNLYYNKISEQLSKKFKKIVGEKFFFLMSMKLDGHMLLEQQSLSQIGFQI